MTNSQHLEPDLLSDLIDDRLEPAERASADAHLVGCRRCVGELSSLRATVAVLRGLPEPVLPRSFHLAASARPALSLRLVTWTRAASALAAALFVVLVSADLLAGLAAPRPSAEPEAPITVDTALRAAPVAPTSEPAVRATGAPASKYKPAAPAAAGAADSLARTPAGVAQSGKSNEVAAGQVAAAPTLAAAAPPAIQEAPAPTTVTQVTPAPTAQAPATRVAAPAPPTLAPARQADLPREPAPVVAPATSSPAGSPLRGWQLLSAVLAVILLVVSLVLNRRRLRR